MLVSHWHCVEGGKLNLAGGIGSIYTPALSAGDTCLVDIRLLVICTNCAISTTEPLGQVYQSVERDSTLGLWVSCGRTALTVRGTEYTLAP